MHAIARIKQDNFFIAYERNPFVETEDQIYRMHTKNDGFLDNDSITTIRNSEKELQRTRILSKQSIKYRKKTSRDNSIP